MYIRVISEETGLYYLQARYYDPETARFISPDETDYLDPQSFGGLNLYIYCLDNPVIYFDKTGNNPTWWQWILFGIGVALVIIASGMTIVGTGGVASFGVGALLGSLSLGAVGATIGGAVGYATGGTEGILGGVLAGFGIGSIIGFVVGGVIGYNAHKLDPDTAMIKEALKKLDKSGLRPGQDRISKSRVMELYKNYDPLKANSSITNLKNTRYLVNGHHTTVANVMRGGNTSFGMGTYCTDIPSATNVYWIKKWYEFGKIAIKIIP